MSGLFQSSKYFIERAKHHVLDLERQSVEFFKTNPYTYLVEVDPKTSEKLHKIKLTKPMPAALPGITSDAVYNLRSALDQAGYAVSNGKRKSTAFPFADSEMQLQNVVNRSCKDLPKEIVDLMCTFKSYKGGNNLLWALNRLCNTNKHAIICPVALSRGSYDMHIINLTNGWPTSLVWDRLKNEMVVARVGLDGDFQANLKIFPYIVMCDIEFVDGQPAVAVLNELIRMVEGMVMAIEAEAHRIGL